MCACSDTYELFRAAPGVLETGGRAQPDRRVPRPPDQILTCPEGRGSPSVRFDDETEKENPNASFRLARPCYQKRRPRVTAFVSNRRGNPHAGAAHAVPGLGGGGRSRRRCAARGPRSPTRRSGRSSMIWSAEAAWPGQRLHTAAPAQPEPAPARGADPPRPPGRAMAFG